LTELTESTELRNDQINGIFARKSKIICHSERSAAKSKNCRGISPRKIIATCLEEILSKKVRHPELVEGSVQLHFAGAKLIDPACAVAKMIILLILQSAAGVTSS
jgi:hypothetical protein